MTDHVDFDWDSIEPSPEQIEHEVLEKAAKLSLEMVKWVLETKESRRRLLRLHYLQFFLLNKTARNSNAFACESGIAKQSASRLAMHFARRFHVVTKKQARLSAILKNSYAIRHKK